MTVSFHKYGEYFPGTGDLRVSFILLLLKLFLTLNKPFIKLFTLHHSIRRIIYTSALILIHPWMLYGPLNKCLKVCYLTKRDYVDFVAFHVGRVSLLCQCFVRVRWFWYRGVLFSVVHQQAGFFLLNQKWMNNRNGWQIMCGTRKCLGNWSIVLGFQWILMSVGKHGVCCFVIESQSRF